MRSRRHRSLCIVIRDVAFDTWPRCQTLLDKLAQIGDFPVTLLAVPRRADAPRDPAFEAWLITRASQGDEVALHGGPRIDSEPAPGDRLDAGLGWLVALGIKPAGVVASARRFDQKTLEALRTHSLAYACDRHRIHRFAASAGATGLSCPALVYSSGSPLRRWLSVLRCESLARLLGGNEVMRLELHPLDVRSPAHRSWQRLVKAESGSRRVETLQSLVRRMRHTEAMNELGK